jgi:hypothetical protein
MFHRKDLSLKNRRREHAVSRQTLFIKAVHTFPLNLNPASFTLRFSDGDSYPSCPGIAGCDNGVDDSMRKDGVFHSMHPEGSIATCEGVSPSMGIPLHTVRCNDTTRAIFKGMFKIVYSFTIVRFQRKCPTDRLDGWLNEFRSIVWNPFGFSAISLIGKVLYIPEYRMYPCRSITLPRILPRRL